MFVEQAFQVKHPSLHFLSHPIWRMITMAMLPEINVLSHPGADAPRHNVSSLSGHAGPAAGPAGLQPLPVSHHVPPVVNVPTQPNYVLRRLGVALAVIATTVVSVFGVGAAGAERTESTESTESAVEPVSSEVVEVAEVTVVLVQPGDTLWTIAERVAPNVDRRAAVDELAKIAGGSMLEVGQRLEIPAITG